MAFERTTHLEKRPARTGLVATGTLACPQCDAPVSPGERGWSPAEWIRCPYCRHVDRVREFLSLAAPSRPARVQVRVVRVPWSPRSAPGALRGA